MGMWWASLGLMAGLVGQPLPAIAGNTLAAKPISLPTAFQGKPGLAILGFKPGARHDCKAWAVWAANSAEKHPGLEVYLAVIVEATPRVAPLVDMFLRAGADDRVADRGLTSYDPDGKLRLAFGVKDDTKALVLLVDRQGKVAWAHDAGFTGEATTALEAKGAQARLW